MQTQHTQAHAGRLRGPGGAGHGDTHSHTRGASGVLGVRVTGTSVDMGLSGHRSDQAPEGLQRPEGGARSEPGSEPGATTARGEACTCLDGAVSTAPGSRAQPAECTSHPEWPSALPIPECLPPGDCPLCARPRWPDPLASAPGGTPGWGQPPQGGGGGWKVPPSAAKAGVRGAPARSPRWPRPRALSSTQQPPPAGFHKGGWAEGQRKWVSWRGVEGPCAGLPGVSSCPGCGVPVPTRPFQGDGRPLQLGVSSVSGSWGNTPPRGPGLVLHEMGLGGPGLWSAWSEASPPHSLTPPSAPALPKPAGRSTLGPRLQHCREAGPAFSVPMPRAHPRPAHTPP